MSDDIPLITHLSSLPLYCIYGLLDDKNGLYLQFSMSSAINQLANTVTKLKLGVHDNKRLQDAFNRGVITLKVFIEYDAPIPDVIARAECSFLVGDYTDLTGVYYDCRYYAKKRLYLDYSNPSSGIPLVYVIAKCSAPGAIVLGIFDNIPEADEWLACHYPGHEHTPVNELRFAVNECTHEYHEKYGYKLQKVIRS